MEKLKDLFGKLRLTLELSTDKEIADACRLIARAQSMDSGERDTLKAAYKHGPLWDGDVPSKQARDNLLDDGFIAKVVVKGEEGYNACTYEGAEAYALVHSNLDDGKFKP